MYINSYALFFLFISETFLNILLGHFLNIFCVNAKTQFANVVIQIRHLVGGDITVWILCLNSFLKRPQTNPYFKVQRCISTSGAKYS